MTIDVPLLINIQNACQFLTGESDNKINGFSTSPNLPVAPARGLPAEFLATPMISCASQHQSSDHDREPVPGTRSHADMRIAQESISVRVCAAALAASLANPAHRTLPAISLQRLATARQSDAIDSMARQLLTSPIDGVRLNDERARAFTHIRFYLRPG
ncbi:hypothetical protein [Bradyrhizobium acaciae]|uniref:hypothetical protein n=1 Tax=Bradyrhizobium acaciae TaxID=2683706 RepID=UPI001E47FD0E|nr:hypothetical protein [Bradyrhizobium acaciae]MCC8982468.1 hypothetical protein [Bradyrhizobium acaciae]